MPSAAEESTVVVFINSKNDPSDGFRGALPVKRTRYTYRSTGHGQPKQHSSTVLYCICTVVYLYCTVLYCSVSLLHCNAFSTLLIVDKLFVQNGREEPVSKHQPIRFAPETKDRQTGRRAVGMLNPSLETKARPLSEP